MELDVRVVALRTVTGAGGVGAQATLALRQGRDILKSQYQGGSLAGKEALAAIVSFAIALVVLGLAILML